MPVDWTALLAGIELDEGHTLAAEIEDAIHTTQRAATRLTDTVAVEPDRFRGVVIDAFTTALTMDHLHQTFADTDLDDVRRVYNALTQVAFAAASSAIADATRLTRPPDPPELWT